MRKIGVVLVVLFVLMPAAVASAHDPIILTAEQTTPARGPLLVDGTISFALYGSLEGPTDTRGFRVQFQQDDPLIRTNGYQNHSSLCNLHELTKLKDFKKGHYEF